MFWFIVGIFTAFFLGMFVMALLAMASRGEDMHQRMEDETARWDAARAKMQNKPLEGEAAKSVWKERE
jgi:hypothetical protein